MQPDNPDFLCLRAACLLRLHLYELAVVDADLALEIDGDFAEVLGRRC